MNPHLFLYVNKQFQYGLQDLKKKLITNNEKWTTAVCHAEALCFRNSVYSPLGIYVRAKSIRFQINENYTACACNAQHRALSFALCETYYYILLSIISSKADWVWDQISFWRQLFASRSRIQRVPTATAGKATPNVILSGMLLYDCEDNNP